MEVHRKSIIVVAIALLCGHFGVPGTAVAQYGMIRLPHPGPRQAVAPAAPIWRLPRPVSSPHAAFVPASPWQGSEERYPLGADVSWAADGATPPNATPRIVPPDSTTGPGGVERRDSVLTRGPDSDSRDWWDAEVSERILRSNYPLAVTVDRLVLSAVRCSPKVQAISDIPLIHETEILVAEARFDFTAFWETKFDYISDPVGNVLTTGGPPRLRDDVWDLSAGVRRKTGSGGTFEVAQRIGYEQSNSHFFVPPHQGNARLTLSFNQPLLNGAGQAYNRGQIWLAQINTDIAWDQMAIRLQDHLLEVVRAYWRLYVQRAVFVQKQKHLAQAQQILEHLQARRSVDAMESQILKARAAVATRQTEVVRAHTAIRNAESRIRALVNDPALNTQADGELVPRELPITSAVDIPLTDALYVALHHRPEIDEAARRLRSAQVRLDLSNNELLPVLNVVLEGYVAGLEGNSDIAQAFGGQFTVGEPGYTVGLVGEVPWGKRAARAKQRRRQLELRQLANELQATTDLLLAEVEVAVREVHASAQEMSSTRAAMLATQSEVDYLDERWQLLAGDDQAASFLLQDLLDAQDRMSAAERTVVTTQVNHALSQCQLKRAMGTLLDCQQVSAHRVYECETPRLILEKNGPGCQLPTGLPRR